MTATAPTTWSASEVLRQIAARQIALVPAFDGKLWVASVDEFGSGVASKRRKVRTISATAATPVGAVKALVEKLDTMATPQELFSEAYEY
jgi:hypothetical protein